jgi:hypothetical protein
MVFNIGVALNQLQGMGVFDYVFPFLIIFAMVFAILQKTKLFEASGTTGAGNAKGINAVIAICVGFLALLNSFVTTFFATIFPRFGVALAIFLVLMIFLGFFIQPDKEGKYPGSVSWIGWVLGIGVVIWAWSNWGEMFGGGIGMNFVSFFSDYFGGIVLLLALGGIIYWIAK